MSHIYACRLRERALGPVHRLGFDTMDLDLPGSQGQLKG